MEFKKIDLDAWPRREWFERFHSAVPCTYSMTVRIDVSKILNAGVKLYPALIYCLAAVVNKHEEFRTAFNSAGELGIYKEMHPSYTVKTKENEYFSVLWTHFHQDFVEFDRRCRKDIEEYAAKGLLEPKRGAPENVFSISMIPWMDFEGFNLNLPKGADYLLPIFTIGRFKREDGVVTLPLAVQVHHAVCDAFHLSRFIEDLQAEIDSIPIRIDSAARD